MIRKLIALLLAAALLTAGLTACGPKKKEEVIEETPPEPRAEASEMSGTLNVLTEATCWGYDAETFRLNKDSPVRDNIHRVIGQFRELYPNMEVELETLTFRSEKRENAIEQRRVAMMAGRDVPDVYLLPTLSGTEISYNPMEPLFKDVRQAMEGHWFADISGLYNGDEELPRDRLEPAVMAAGTMGSARYVLPLGYSYQMCLFDRAEREKAGIPLDGNLSGLLETALKLAEEGDPRWAMTLYGLAFGNGVLDLFPELCDYEKEEPLIGAEPLADFFWSIYQCGQETKEHWEWDGVGGTANFSAYLMGGYDSAVRDGTPLVVLPLETTMESIAMAKSQGRELDLMPLRAEDGSLGATITYWGAVGAGCENPKAAYEFLRLFLTEPVQHGGEVRGESVMFHNAVVGMGIGILPGWPVLDGFTEPLWDLYVSDELTTYDDVNGVNRDRLEALRSVRVTEEDLPLAPVDRARFPSALDQEFNAFASQLDYTKDTHTQSDTQKWASDFLRSVRYHLGEG